MCDIILEGRRKDMPVPVEGGGEDRTFHPMPTTPFLQPQTLLPPPYLGGGG